MALTTHSDTLLPEHMGRTVQVVAWAKVAAWASLIYTLSGDFFAEPHTYSALQYWVATLRLPISETGFEVANMAIRKAAHFTEFFVLGILLFQAISGGEARFRVRVACWACAVGAVYALADEFRQMFESLRTPSLRDSAMDIAGVLASQAWVLLRSRLP